VWVYLQIEPDGPEHRAELVKGKKRGLYDVLYDATCRSISAAFSDIDGLVIPELANGFNYDVNLLILQLRLETTSGLQRLPIKVTFGDEERCASFAERFGMSDRGLENIGVALVLPGDSPGSVPACLPQADAVDGYLQAYASRSRFTQGRHNQANRWGPYIFFRVLEKLKPRFSERRQSIEQKMFEEPYLKRLAGMMRDGDISSELLEKLRKERDNFRDRLLGHKRDRKILVIEDRLDEGWREVYEAFFDAELSRISVDWATTVDEAHAKFDRDVDLVVLDVRLDQKDEDLLEGYEGLPSGVTLAKWLREQSGTVPILAATASNKTWIMERLLPQGIQGYWVKESPEQGGDLRHATRNVLDLYRKAREIIEWSDRTRPWINGLYEIAQEVSESDPVQGSILGKKAKSLHSLLHRAFSPFSQELDDGLQLNVALLILFSCMNDLRAWCLPSKDKGDGKKDWCTVDELGGVCVVRYRPRLTEPFEIVYNEKHTKRKREFEDIER
jgi:CheY-like chemotaxis protein